MEGRASGADLNLALNEARWLGIVPRQDLAACLLTFDVLTLGPRDDGDGHEVRSIGLRPVSRVSVSYEIGALNDGLAEVAPISLADLNPVLESFDGQPLYGMNFFDPPASSRTRVRERLSMDAIWSERDATHAILLSLESIGSPARTLDVLIEFDFIDAVFDDAGNSMDIAEFVSGARRWWEGLGAGDERTSFSLIRLQGTELPPVGSYMRASNRETADRVWGDKNQKKSRWPWKRESTEQT